MGGGILSELSFFSLLTKNFVFDVNGLGNGRWDVRKVSFCCVLLKIEVMMQFNFDPRHGPRQPAMTTRGAWRLRTQREIAALLEELSAIHPIPILHKMYGQATSDQDHSW